MAIDVLQAVFEILRVGNFANQYSSQMDQFLYAVFFPMILLIAIITILTSNLFGKDNKKLQLLFSIAFFVFIIVYPPNAQTSLYGAIAPISTVWYIVVIIIGVLWVLFHRISPRSSGGRGLTTSGGSGLSSLKEAALGKTILDPAEHARAKKLWKDELKLTEDEIRAIHKSLQGQPTEIKKEAQAKLTDLEARAEHCRKAIHSGWPFDK